MRCTIEFKRPRVRIYIFLFSLFCIVFTVNSQHEFDHEIIRAPQFFYSHPNARGVVEKEKAMFKSESGDSYHFMDLRSSIGAINALVLATEKDFWIEEQITIINNVINAAKKSADIPYHIGVKDDFRGWISLEEGKSTYLREVPLYEGYSFLYITHFLYILDQIGWVEQSNENNLWWHSTLNFIEDHVWTKWFVRSYQAKGNNYWYFIRGRTHMGSHFAGIAMYLSELTGNLEIKFQAKTTIEQFDTLLRRNLREVQGAYVWNSTYDNIEGTNADEESVDAIQDVSHGNHVITYVVAAYEFGNPNWTIQDIQKLVNTVKVFMFDEVNMEFSDNVDGTASHNRPGWGNSIADGWVKLGDYDEELKTIFLEFEQTDKLRGYNQEFQYRANMYSYKLE